MLCDCEDKEHGQDVAFMSQDPLPQGSSMREHLARFVAEFEAQPALSNYFPVRQFVNDFLANGLISKFQVLAAPLWCAHALTGV